MTEAEYKNMKVKCGSYNNKNVYVKRILRR